MRYLAQREKRQGSSASSHCPHRHDKVQHGYALRGMAMGIPDHNSASKNSPRSFFSASRQVGGNCHLDRVDKDLKYVVLGGYNRA
jgi:hypothetical protein